jgi:hypothetical protein
MIVRRSPVPQTMSELPERAWQHCSLEPVQFPQSTCKDLAFSACRSLQTKLAQRIVPATAPIHPTPGRGGAFGALLLKDEHIQLA